MGDLNTVTVPTPEVLVEHRFPLLPAERLRISERKYRLLYAKDRSPDYHNLDPFTSGLPGRYEKFHVHKPA
jgi:hypothetical protein